MPIRITGFSGSGLDVQGMVSALLEAEQIPILRLQSNIAAGQQRLTAWSDVSTDLSGLHSSVKRLTSFSAWQQVRATASDENTATALASNDAPLGRYQTDVTQLASAHRISSDSQVDTTSALDLRGRFQIGGQEINVERTHSLQDIRDAINTAAGSMADEDAVRASIIDTTLVIEREQSGSTEIQLQETSGRILRRLGVFDSSRAVKNELTAAQDLQATVSGVPITRSSNTGLTDVIQGVTLNFHKTGASDITIDRDIDAIKTLLEDFVTAYNSALATIEDQTSIDLSSETGDVGMLQGESALRAARQKLRQIVTGSDDTTLDPTLNSLRKIGIHTTGEDNRLSLVDGDALESALLSDYEAVEDLIRDFDAGVLKKLDDYLDVLTRPVDGTVASRQGRIQDRIDENEDRIADMERRLIDYEADLFARFGQMEASVAALNQQTAFITGLFQGTG